MDSSPLQKSAAWILLLLLLTSLFCLPAFALPNESGTGDLSDTATADLTDDLTDGLTDGMLPDGGATDGLPNTDNGIGDGEDIPDGTAQNGTSTAVTTAERDPIDAVGNAAGGANWVTVVICIVIVIAMILIIVALIPKKHKS